MGEQIWGWTIRIAGMVLSQPPSGRVENPFYIALPYCDMQDGYLKAKAAMLVPWFSAAFRECTRSACKDRWIEIRHGLKTCYAQWEEVGPFRTDSAAYVFGGERPPANIVAELGSMKSLRGRSLNEGNPWELILPELPGNS